MDMAQECGMGRRYEEYIMLVTEGHYEGKLAKARLLGETGLSVEAGDLTSTGQRLILREFMHPRRQQVPMDPEEHPAD
jgi:hypothetical protein